MPEKNKEQMFSVRVRAFIKKNEKVLLVKEQEEHYYETPGGGVQRGETIEQALRREVLEETGYAVKIEKILDVAEKMLKDGRHAIHLIFICEPTEKIKEPLPDIVDVRWFSRDEIKQRLADGLIDIHDKRVMEMFCKEENKKQVRNDLHC